MPAEWEPQSCVQLTWPHEHTDWAPMLDDILTTYREMKAAIERYEPVMVVMPPSDDTWARDHAFITLVPDASNLPPSSGIRRFSDGTVAPIVSTVKLLDFRFDGWGGKFPAEKDNALNRRIYDEGRVSGEYVDCKDFVLEGGSIECDGRGTVFTTSHCLLDPNRRMKGCGSSSERHADGRVSRSEVEELLKRRLGARRIVWIDHGHLAGDDTDGHIDTLVRVAPDDTLLYVGCDDKDDEHYAELRLMEHELQALRTDDGRPYRLLRLPLPRAICEAGERLPATYANFLVINGAVLVPTYAQPDLDAEAMKTVGEAFPGRDIVPVDCRAIIRQHGSLHCCTMQYPEGVFVK